MVKREITIASGESLSGAEVNIDGAAVVGIVMPEAWTAANLTLQFSKDDETYYNVYDADGNEVVVTAAASRYIVLNPAEFSGANAMKIRSGTSGSPVAQAEDRTLTVVLLAL